MSYLSNFIKSGKIHVGSLCPEEAPQKLVPQSKMFRFTFIHMVAIWSFLINSKMYLFEVFNMFKNNENIHGGS